MLLEIPADWRAALASATHSDSFQQLVAFVHAERSRTDTAIYPSAPDVFRALHLTPISSVRAVILGQDPYHGAGQAHGLSFSVPAGVAPPPSLRNILTEWEANLHLPATTSGSLEPWARHGVLLLNTVMTVRQGGATSHRGMGWEPFTDAIVRVVAAKEAPVVFLLWGRSAQRKVELISERHIIIQASHPSPLSATRGQTPFRTSRPFSTANVRLAALGQTPIDWSLTDAV